MHQFAVKNIPLVLTEEGDAIRVKTPDKNVLLSSQNTENVQMIIEDNFKIVDAFYLHRIGDNPGTSFDPDDIHHLSIAIVLHYLYMYNSWRLQYKAKKYQDLGFKQEDFEHPGTHDIIFSYYRSCYPGDWGIKCSVLMAMGLDDLRRYYERRVQYYNK